MRAARALAAPLVQGECRPIVFEEKRPKTGKGGAAYKSLTAAVKAAEREKEEARALKVACDEVLAGCCKLLKRMEGEVARVRRWLLWDAVVCSLMFATLILYMWLG